MVVVLQPTIAMHFIIIVVIPLTLLGGVLTVRIRAAGCSILTAATRGLARAPSTALAFIQNHFFRGFIRGCVVNSPL